MFPNRELDFERDGLVWPNRDASRFIEVEGIRWHVQELGDGPVILLLHRTGASTRSWRGLMPFPSSTSRVVAVDLPGHASPNVHPAGCSRCRVWRRGLQCSARASRRSGARGGPFGGRRGHDPHGARLGDLRGGWILKPVLARMLGLQPAGLSFYDFPAIDDVNAAKREMRDALDAVPAEGPEAKLVVAEAIAALRHNIAVSKSVQPVLG